MDTIFVIISFFSILSGLLIAWFNSSGFWKLSLRIILVNIALIALLIFIAEGLPNYYSLEYLINGMVYLIFPIVIFVLIPSLTTGLIVFCLKSFLRKRPPKGL